jgi:hypothetical protein
MMLLAGLRPFRSREPARRIRCRKDAPRWSPGRGGAPCQPPPTSGIAASRSTPPQGAGRGGAACRSRVLRHRRHPEHLAIDPAATHAHRHQCHRAPLRPRPVRRVHPPSRRRSMTVADGVLWVLDASGTVVRLDPQTNAVVGKPLRAPADAVAIAVDQGALWSPASPPGTSAGGRGRGNPHRPGERPHGGDHHGPPSGPGRRGQEASPQAG